MMAKPREKIEEMLKEKDPEENRIMKLGEMKLSKFGFGLELTGFVAFLGWTGMCLFSLLGLVGMALITVPIDFPTLFRFDWDNVLAIVSSGPGPGPRSGPGQVPGQVQKVKGVRTKDLDLG